jgi:hypothetical protein
VAVGVTLGYFPVGWQADYFDIFDETELDFGPLLAWVLGVEDLGLPVLPLHVDCYLLFF